MDPISLLIAVLVFCLIVMLMNFLLSWGGVSYNVRMILILVVGVLFLIYLLRGNLFAFGQQSAQTCGQGIVIRSNGSVAIDSYKTFLPNPQFNPANSNPSVPSVVHTEFPTKLVLGSSLSDSLPVCLESESDTSCIQLGKLRNPSKK